MEALLKLLVEKLFSRKLAAAILYPILVLANKKLGLGISDSEILAIAGTVAAYLVGQGIADGAANKTGKVIEKSKEGVPEV